MFTNLAAALDAASALPGDVLRLTSSSFTSQISLRSGPHRTSSSLAGRRRRVRWYRLRGSSCRERPSRSPHGLTET